MDQAKFLQVLANAATHLLKKEMVHFCQLGFVEETEHSSVWRIPTQDGVPFNMRDFCRITKDGLEQLSLLADARRLVTDQSED